MPMTSDGTAERMEEGGEAGLLLRADDGSAYLIPRAALEQYRLSDEGRAALEEQAAEAGDVRGHGQYIGQFSMTMPVWVPVFGPAGYWRTDPYALNTRSGPYPGLR
jgi:hypothetical protein